MFNGGPPTAPAGIAGAGSFGGVVVIRHSKQLATNLHNCCDKTKAAMGSPVLSVSHKFGATQIPCRRRHWRWMITRNATAGPGRC